VRLLLVEDEELLGRTVRDGLAEQGHAVTLVRTGVEGLVTASSGRFDVVILDIMLPGLSGYRVLRELRTARIWTPVLMLTAKDGEFDEADAFDLGADDYLTKPFSFLVLLARLRALQRRGRRARPTLLVVDDLVLDPARHTVRRGDSSITTTPTEFALLEFLMRRADEVVGKAEILEAVWDPHYEGDQNIVEVYVGHLRRKIDVPFGRSTIQTVRGVGYRLAGTGG
jgi:two-component system OmpR family response regulator